MARKGIMLAYPFEEKRLLKWPKPWIIQPKLDGDRCRAVFSSEGVATMLSSEENIITYLPHINVALDKLGLRDMELDGELYIHGADHSAIHSIVSRTENIHPEYDSMEFHIFDLLDYKCPHNTQAERTLNLHLLKLKAPLIHVNYGLVYTLDDIMRWSDAFSKDNYEGFVIRNTSYPYLRKRSTGMMKFKPRKQDIYPICGYSVEMDMEGNIKSDLLGRLICGSLYTMPILGEYPAHTKLPEGYFGVGTGFTPDMRRDYWKSRHYLPGKMVMVKYQHITSGRGVPRFPVFSHIVEV